MASKMVTDRQKSSASVVQAATQQGEVLGAALAQRSLAESGVALDVSGLLNFLATTLETSVTTLINADEAHERELADDPGARDARDEAARSLYDDVVSARAMLTAVYGDAVVDSLGFFGSTSRDPVVLARQGRSVVSRLRSGSLPTPRSALVTLDTAALASQLDAKVTTLEERLADVAREGREAQLTLTEKQRALAEHDVVFSGVATTLTGLFTLAGLPELAARVRPSRRHAGRTEEEVTE